MEKQDNSNWQNIKGKSCDYSDHKWRVSDLTAFEVNEAYELVDYSQKVAQSEKDKYGGQGSYLLVEHV